MKPLFIAACLFLILHSCQKSYDLDGDFVIEGYLYDTVMNVPLQDFEIRLVSYWSTGNSHYCGFCGSPIKVLARTTTNEDGYFKILLSKRDLYEDYSNYWVMWHLQGDIKIPESERRQKLDFDWEMNAYSVDFPVRTGALVTILKRDVPNVNYTSNPNWRLLIEIEREWSSTFWSSDPNSSDTITRNYFFEPDLESTFKWILEDHKESYDLELPYGYTTITIEY